MNKDLFQSWLKTFKKFDVTTSKARTSNCLRIEKYYGDLDEIFENDQCIALLEEFNYTITDKQLGNNPKHKIPINGNVYTGTSTLKSALKLYIEFKKNKFIGKVTALDNEYENYWFLNAKPSIWSFNELEIGERVTYTSVNEAGNKRRIYRNFEDAKVGEIVIGYESTPVKSIVAICKVAKEHDGERIVFEKVRNLIEPIEYEVLKNDEALQNMEY